MQQATYYPTLQMYLHADLEEPDSNIRLWTPLRPALAGGYWGVLALGPLALSSPATSPLSMSLVLFCHAKPLA